MNKYFLGIDNGGSVCKAVIFDINGMEVATASENLKMMTPHPGHTERDMDELWMSNCNVIRKVIALSGINKEEIKGVACTGHGKGLYLWGKGNRPCYNGIISTDSRAWMYPQQWQLDGTADRVFEKTYQKILACQPVSILCWLKDHHPEVLKNIKWIFEVKDYIRYKLTGEAYAEMTDYSGSSLMNIKDVCYDKELLKEFGLEDVYKCLPPLKSATEICGYVTEHASQETGLKEGTPVAGGMFDIDACAIAMNITNEDNIAVIAGTWGINEYISKTPVLNKSIMMNSLYCMDGYYLIEECSATSASNYAWFIDMFMEEAKIKARKEGINVYEYCNKIASDVKPQENSIVFLPYIFGSNYNPKGKATLIGMDSHHTKADILRAVIEGIVFCHMVHIEKLLANKKETITIRLAGGVANSDLWAQIFADVINLPVEIIDTKELGALGCAIAAAVATGEYKDIADAAGNMVKIKRRIIPISKNVCVYAKKYQAYKRVAEACEKLWEVFSA